jgi:hypothetical protein
MAISENARKLRAIREEKTPSENRKKMQGGNTKALADPTYNPEFHKAALKLYKLMTPCDGAAEDTATLNQYKAIYLALPTKNIYTPVIVNPRKCVKDETKADVSTVKALFPQVRAKLSTDDQPAWDAMVADVTPDLDGLSADLDDMQTQTDRIIANLPSLAGLAQGATGIDTALNGLPNPCGVMPNFLGSIMSAGQDIMNQVNGAINSLTSQLQSWVSGALGTIGAMTSAVTSLVGQATAAMSQMMSMLADEVTNFANAMIGQLRMGLADFLANVTVDPCLNSLLSGATGLITTAAAAAIGSVPSTANDGLGGLLGGAGI